jgi:hypothetical protein
MVNAEVNMSQQDVFTDAEDPHMESAWARVSRWLHERKHNQQWLADSLGYDKGRVSNWARRGIPTAEYPNIARITGETVDWVAGVAESKSFDFDKLSPIAKRVAIEFDTITDPDRQITAFAQIIAAIERARTT